MGSSDLPPAHSSLHKSVTVPELGILIHIAIGHVSSFGPQFSIEHKKLLAIEDRLEQGTFRLAVLGSPGSGKSTLIYALLGDTFLPAFMDFLLPGIPTLVRYGPQPLVRIWSYQETPSHEFSGKTSETFLSFLQELVAEKDNLNDDHQRLWF
ncbi:MAG: hypothetical protein ACLQPD_13225 [Desulfomonilaceae bacterium]